ncbi:MAG: GFA family protein [Actinomycetota bacterium]
MQGSCLCGSIHWSTSGDLRPVLECHCHRCQKLTGNFMAATATATSDLVIDGDRLRWYSPDDDRNVAYAFCSECGSSLFFRTGIADGSNTTTSICAGTIDGESGLATSEIWFAHSAADHVRIDAELNPGITLHAGQPAD